MFPTLFDDVSNISISDLKKWGYLVEGKGKRGVVIWSTNGNKTGSIGIRTNLLYGNYYLELKYTYNGNLVNYKVELITIPSNLGKGVIFYFICPVTSMRCRKLYMISGRFLHREAFKGCMYKKQTWSRRARELNRILEMTLCSDSLFDELDSKYLKKTYAGKPSKRFLKIRKKIDKVMDLTLGEIESVLSL